MEEREINQTVIPVIPETVSKRITSLRFILACLVVMFHNNKTLLFVLSPGGISLSNPEFLAHLPQIFFQYVLSAAPVPLFFMFSSYLSGKKNYPYLVLIKKKLRSLLLPLLLWPVLVIGFRILLKLVLILVFPDKVSHELPFVHEWNLRDWFCAFFGYYFPAYNRPILCEPFILPLYFIRDLLIMDMISPLIKKVVRCCAIPFMLLLAAMYFLSIRPIIVCTNAFVFYSIGIYCAEYDFDFFEFVDRIPWKVIFVFILIFMGIYVRFHSSDYIVLFSCILTLKYSKIIAEGSEKVFAVIKYLSGFSFFLYAIHDSYLLMIFTTNWFNLVPRNFVTDLLEYFVLAPLLCVVGTVIGITLKKVIPKLFYLLNGR